MAGLKGFGMNVIESHPGSHQSAKTTDQLSYLLIMPVWGDHHTGLFLRYCIPFLLTDGNVGAFADRRLRVRVMSRRVDLDRMKKGRQLSRSCRSR